MAALPDPPWFLPSAPGNGDIWGLGTNNLKRSNSSQNTWDGGCRVTPLIGGYEATADMRRQLKKAIALASAAPAGQPAGHVYIADWRFNSARDLSDPADPSTDDESALGLVLRLMKANIAVRLLLWMPTRTAVEFISGPHAQDHMYVARVIQAYDQQVKFGAATPLGVCLLDRRLPRIASAHHQKMMIVRVGTLNVAYCGGVDFAYTRRDTPNSAGAPQTDSPFPSSYSSSQPQFLGGDPQSGDKFMIAQSTDPNWIGRSIGGLTFPITTPPTAAPPNDLPSDVYGANQQYWHDQHVKIEGPAVSALEWVFCERWSDDSASPPLFLNPSLETIDGPFEGNEIVITSKAAVTADGTSLVPLPDPAPTLPPTASSATDDVSAAVQIWRTVPLRDRGDSPQYFSTGEFSAMFGISNAVGNAKQLIWIFDQYFWSQPLAVQLNKQLYANPNLRVILILPPHADTQAGAAHWARAQAYASLLWIDPTKVSSYPNGIASQVGIFALWNAHTDVGVYVHAKAHIYDANLLVIGSANCNARSYTGDTEVVAAIIDPPTTYAHMVRLWDVLFPPRQGASSWPWGRNATDSNALTASSTNWGATFFSAFVAKAGAGGTSIPSCNVFPDAVTTGGMLPNGVQLMFNPVAEWGVSSAVDVLEAHGINSAVETVAGGQGIASLQVVSKRVRTRPSLWRIKP